MIELWEPIGEGDAYDARLATEATGLLRAFNQARVLTAADVHVATRAGVLTETGAEEARLALALAVRGVRQGSVCVSLAELVASEPSLPWPAEGWLDRVAASPLADRGVVRVEGDLLYLDRYHREEGQVRDDLLARLARPAPALDEARLVASAERLFPGEGYAGQRAAALAATRQWTTVLTGGPGTGKTTTVAGLLALLAEQEPGLRVALTAPTGKAAARLQESVAATRAEPRFSADDRARLTGLTATTLHRLLGWRPGSSTRFKHHRGNRLPHDVIVVDETSMVSLTMMARLLEAVRPEARLILVGDPHQLASVEAGAVLGDLVEGLAQVAPSAVAALTTTHRYGRAIGALAEAIRAGDDAATWELLNAGDPAVGLLDDPESLREPLTAHAAEVTRLALRGDGPGAVHAAERERLLCAHRDGPYGAAYWNRQIERWLGQATGLPVGVAVGREWYAGRPVLVTANDYGLGLFNGDTGVTVREGDTLRALIGSQRFAPSRLAGVETLHAMTVHKSQGSQADAVTVLLPPPDSPLLTRELLYTAVTRARSTVRVVGSEESVRMAVTRRALRASGLRARLARDAARDIAGS